MGRIEETYAVGAVFLLAALGAVLALVVAPAAHLYSVSRLDVTYGVASACGLIGVAAFIGLILAPAVGAYARAWERLVATLLSFYVLAAMIGLGLLAAAGVVWLWGRYG